MAKAFPGVPVKDDLPEHGTLLGIDKARGPELRARVHLARAVLRAQCRTRTDDPFLTMEVLYQLS